MFVSRVRIWVRNCNIVLVSLTRGGVLLKFTFIIRTGTGLSGEK